MAKVKPLYDIATAWLERVTFSAAEGPRIVLLGFVGPHTLRRTSPVERVDGDLVETENSRYRVTSWAVVPSLDDLQEIAKWGGDSLALH